MSAVCDKHTYCRLIIAPLESHEEIYFPNRSKISRKLPSCYVPLQEEDNSDFSTLVLDCVGCYDSLPGFLFCLTGK
jgi:hypothetical protein